jgi:TolA-binding protein
MAEAVQDHFAPSLFWGQHKQKILVFLAVLVLGLVGFALFELANYRERKNAQALLAAAENEADYRRVIESYPRSTAAANAHLLLAEKLRSEGKLEESTSTLRRFVENFPEHPLAGGAWLSLGANLESEGKIEEALDCYRQTVTRYPQSFSAPLALLAEGNLLRFQGKKDDARRVYESVLSQYPQSYSAQEATRQLSLLR